MFSDKHPSSAPGLKVEYLLMVNSFSVHQGEESWVNPSTGSIFSFVFRFANNVSLFAMFQFLFS
jgi:hypothetical protein